MSIEPEVPYTFDYDDSSDELEDSWRDPSISQTPREYRTAANQVVNSRDTPNDYWVLPGWNIESILGSGRSRISEIEKKTGSHIAYNEDKRQIDIWGDASAIQETKNYLNLIYSKLNETDTRNMRKTKKWEKPERELTEREKRRNDKRQARLAEEKSYQGIPAVPQPYNAIFCIPSGDLVPIVRLTGDKESYLNKIRAECKAHLWYDPTENGFVVTGSTEKCVAMATSRIRNHYLKNIRLSSGFKKQRLLIMQQPKENWVIKFRRLPSNFEFGPNYSSEELEAMFASTYLCEVGKPGIPTALDLIQLDDPKHSNESTNLSETARGMTKHNIKHITQVLEPGLERLRLTDWEIRMKFRFGQIHLSNFKPKENVFLPIEKVSEKLFRSHVTRSELAPCLSTSRSGLDSLFEYLSIHGEEFSDSPKTSFTIHADQHPQLQPPRLPGSRRPPPRGEKFRTILKTNFTADGHAGLWNCLTDCEDAVTIDCVDIESRYSWDLKLQFARRLINEIDTPHVKFVKQLSLNKTTGRLIMMIDEEDYDPEFVVQKQTWKYGWKDYIIEVCMDEVWYMDDIQRKHRELPVDLSEKEPTRTIFKVALYKEGWIDRFSQNLYLSVGEAPLWNVKSFLASEDENVKLLMEAAKEFSDILSSHIPLYWDRHVDSLV